MALLNKIGQVLTSDITKDFKFSRKNKLNDDLELTFVDQLKKRRSIDQLGKRVHSSQTYLGEIIQEELTAVALRLMILKLRALWCYLQILIINSGKL